VPRLDTRSVLIRQALLGIAADALRALARGDVTAAARAYDAMDAYIADEIKVAERSAVDNFRNSHPGE
jgi:hypothetical protein